MGDENFENEVLRELNRSQTGISTQIARISGNVSDALTAIAAKGVTVPSGSNSDDLATLIAAIETGGGGGGGGGGSATLITKSITANGTYNASDDSADGYSSVTVNVPSGASSWKKIAEASYQVSTTSTSWATVATLETGDTSIWTSAKWVYVRVRDTAGKRNGYFYGSDNFFININPANNASADYINTGFHAALRVDSGGLYAVNSTVMENSYGVVPDRIYPNGDIRIRRRYSSSNSLTINGTYKVEVYLLDPAGNVSIFA